jgi:hypothetical protein
LPLKFPFWPPIDGLKNGSSLKVTVKTKPMEVDFNTGRNPIAGASQPASRPEATSKQETTNMSFERTTALEQSLKAIPLVRPEKLAQATALAADPNYPSNEKLNHLADLFATHLNR